MTPSTSALVSKTAPAQRTAVAASPAPPAAKSGPVYTAAPLCTIDLAQLKPTRFLVPPAALPYRDAEGRVALMLLRDSVSKVDDGTIEAPDDVSKTLRKWLRHAEHEVAKGGYEWVANGDGTWTGPGGETRAEVAPADAETDEEDDGEGGESSEPEDDDDDAVDANSTVAEAAARKRKADASVGADGPHGGEEGAALKTARAMPADDGVLV